MAVKPAETGEPTQEGTVSQSDIAAIVGGYHGQPFSVLGMHLVEARKKSLAIRLFRPLDQEVTIILEDGKEYPAKKLDPAGFFEALIPGRKKPPAYRLRLTSPDGETVEINDPYRFNEPYLTEYERYLHGEGNFLDSYRKMGAHVRTIDGVTGVSFAVWAPNAERVSVIGPFNFWDDRVHPMQSWGAGIWELFIPGLTNGSEYKYAIQSRHNGYQVDKADPYAYYAQVRPETASRVWDRSDYEWNDGDWLEQRQARQAFDQPINVYEVHLGSWKRSPEDNGFLSYRDLAHQLVDHVRYLGYTHIELLPITEHPFDGSWGYQTVGYFAPTSRFGSPDEFRYFVDHCHQNDIGVILDWVPAHFPRDAHGLGYFDGTHLYEHADPRQGEHRDWGTKIFNFGRNEVRNFLLSSALFWLEEYHLDGLRVDAVASMLYLDYSREAGDWIPNRYGGRENLEALAFIRQFNEVTHERVPGIITIAEESTSWPMVSRPVYTGGLGFDFKWNMGWMHDTLEYFEKDSVFRRYSHSLVTFSLIYAFSENFMLPFSHDEVVHLKRSMLDKMPGDLWQKFANLRTLYGYMTGHPGKKLLFMGGEFGQWREWTEAFSLDWHLLEHDAHRKLLEYVRQLNLLYLQEPALHQVDTSWEGFSWIDLHDVDQSILSFQRMGADASDHLVVACNFTPVPRMGYRVGLPSAGPYREILNSDAREYGGSGVENPGILEAEPIPWQSGSHSLPLNLPPLGVIYLKPINQ